MANVEQFPFRLVIRGTLNGKRVRRVVTVHTSEAEAYEMVGDKAEEISKRDSLTNVFFNVYPPSGIRCDGALSKGHVLSEDRQYVNKVKA